MSSKIFSIRIPDQMREYLDSFDTDTGVVLRTIVDRYRTLTAAELPEYTEGQWCLICDVLNGCGALMGSPEDYAGFWASVYDSADDGYGEKWGVDAKAFGLELRKLPDASRMAVWDVAARFWGHRDLVRMTHRELLEAAGARIKEDGQ